MYLAIFFLMFVTSAFSQSPDPGEYHLLSRADLPSCMAFSSGGRVFFPECVGKVMMTTIVGRKSIGCADLDQYRFVGLVHLKTDYCDQTLTTLDACEFHPFGAGPVSRPCRVDMHTGLVLVIGFLIVVLYAQVAMIRWVYLFYLYKKDGKKLVNVKREGLHYKFYMTGKKHLDGGSLRNGGVGINDTRLLDVSSTFKLSVCQVLVFCLLMFNPVKADLTSYSLLIGSNSSVVKPGLTITSDDLVTAIPLSLEFSTAEVVSDSSGVKYFLDSDCSRCMDMLNSPQTVSRSVENDWRGPHFTLETCWPLKTGISIHDLVNHSCEKRWYKFFWRENEEWMVFSVSNGLSRGGVRVSSETCVVDEVEDLVPLGLKGSVVMSPEGAMMYCPNLEITETPQTDNLGSFRIFRNGEFIVANGFMTCSASPSGLSCNRHNFGTDTLPKRCCKLPCKYKGLEISAKDFNIEVRRNPSRRVKITCTKPQPPDDCGGVISDATGSSEGGFGILMQFRTVRKTNGFWTGFIPCLKSNMSIPCDGEGITLVANIHTTCLKEVPKERKHLLPPEIIRSHAKDEIGFDTSHLDNKDVFGALRHTLGDTIMGLILASPLMSLVCLMLLCKLTK